VAELVHCEPGTFAISGSGTCDTCPVSIDWCYEQQFAQILTITDFYLSLSTVGPNFHYRPASLVGIRVRLGVRAAYQAISQLISALLDAALVHGDGTSRW
jgi:hypothetical protein